MDLPAKKFKINEIGYKKKKNRDSENKHLFAKLAGGNGVILYLPDGKPDGPHQQDHGRIGAGAE